MHDVGLGYIRLGQPSTELSGMRPRESGWPRSCPREWGKTIYILTSPPQGLHFADVHKLIDILYRLSEGVNTVVVIEHT